MKVDVLELAEWETPASHYKLAQAGNYRLVKHTYQPGLYAYHGIDGYALFSVKKPIESTVLQHFRQGKFSTSRWYEWMVDSPTDYRAMQKYAERAYGKVLTSGLGLGLLTVELCKNSRVTNITVIEIAPEVIELIEGYLPGDPRINIVQSDFWKFVEQDNSKWDWVIADIWIYWGLQEQLRMYREEIVPASEKLKVKYPESQVVCHGFAGMPTLKELDKVIAEGNGTNPLVIDPLIYGLQR